MQCQNGVNPNDSYYSPQVTFDSAEKIERLSALLAKKLGPEYLSNRKGPGGSKLHYIEGWRVINLANEVFGFNGWSSEVRNLEVDFLDVNEEGRISAHATATIRITLADGAFREDLGTGTIDNCKSKMDALAKIKKEAVTDGMKRAMRNFGNLLGNCVYDKQYLEDMSKIKQPPKQKFAFSELHRAAYLAEKPEAKEPDAANGNAIAGPSGIKHHPQTTTSAPIQQNRVPVQPHRPQQVVQQPRPSVLSARTESARHPAALSIANAPARNSRSPASVTVQEILQTKQESDGEQTVEVLNEEYYLEEGLEAALLDDSGFDEASELMEMEEKPEAGGSLPQSRIDSPERPAPKPVLSDPSRRLADGPNNGRVLRPNPKSIGTGAAGLTKGGPKGIFEIAAKLPDLAFGKDTFDGTGLDDEGRPIPAKVGFAPVSTLKRHFSDLMPGDDGDEGVQPKISPVERARQAEQIQRKKEEAMRRRMQNQQNRP